jgi:Na+/H+ antiporter NhaD/arsenite permease-like protein
MEYNGKSQWFSYEEYYEVHSPKGLENKKNSMPFLYKLNDDVWSLITESELIGSNYIGMFLKGKKEAVTIDDVTDVVFHKTRIAIYLALFVLAFLVVLKVLPFEIVLAVTVAVVFFMERKVLKDVDYCLLLTFISFFVFTGNMGNIPAIKTALQQLVEGREVLIGILSSQAISNVPAALLLSGFTGDYKALLVGVNLGGLGTLIASMASLISYKILANKYNDKKGKYFLWFTLANVGFLFVLWMASLFIG